MIQAYILLTISIACEVIGTTMLPATKGFTVRRPTIIAVTAYVICFAALAGA